MRFKGSRGRYYCCTTNICFFDMAKRDPLERKSILHSDSAASELPQPLSYHNLYLILTSLAIPPYQWSLAVRYEPTGGSVWVSILITVILSVLYVQLVTECPFSTTRDVQVLFTVFIVSADLGDQSVVINHLPGISWAGRRRLIKMNPKMNFERS